MDPETEIWLSPDQIIKKEILQHGTFGPKPTECSICQVKFYKIPNFPDGLSEYLSSEDEKSVIVGEGNTFVDRKIDEVLLTMKKGEFCKVCINNENFEVSFTLCLVDFESKGYVYQWTAEEKCKIALHHKQEGIKLFQSCRFKDASHRFSKSLKLLLSIPVPVDANPEKIDNLPLEDLKNYKTNLYNNLASCYSKENHHFEVIKLCTKVLEHDKDNIKALCKRGFAYAGEKDYDRAKIDLEKVLQQDQSNKAAIEKLSFVNHNINLQQANFNQMIKKMFIN